ncbi:GNAT family N-acetyltransferase [Paenibacillus barcinonensis]|uniref:GNAT family N-acetyltransferase n=1 Tax=Paenibacillus barcinonensis TaxID=198119 RepID=A0A2V4VG17_PAEBA|nr:GNAT family N-acetyltransferase [Paenibacillus barcinonensis]PYE52282.1 ribosomal protein S18 acetylase RimI-like enzyme [Paenibacillus barcinonensis]QKS59592.1 GNAT family N-acetyltransferase [Paenibacillus barcinonensis]
MKDSEVQETQFRIRQANINDISEVSRLFDKYRIFYGQPSDLEGASDFIKERISKDESIIFIAESGRAGEGASAEALSIAEHSGESPMQAAGFVQIYPSFSSVSMAPIWVLNDLFVDSNSRQQGIARKLLQAVTRAAQKQHIVRITLSTAVSNLHAQALYESEAYTQDQSFMYYERSVHAGSEA